VLGFAPSTLLSELSANLAACAFPMSPALAKAAELPSRNPRRVIRTLVVPIGATLFPSGKL